MAWCGIRVFRRPTIYIMLIIYSAYYLVPDTYRGRSTFPTFECFRLDGVCGLYTIISPRNSQASGCLADISAYDQPVESIPEISLDEVENVDHESCDFGLVVQLE